MGRKRPAFLRGSPDGVPCGGCLLKRLISLAFRAGGQVLHQLLHVLRDMAMLRMGGDGECTICRNLVEESQ